MKKTIRNIIKTFAILLLVAVAYTVSAQGPPPPPGGSGGSGNNENNSQGGGAPLGSGIAIMVVFIGAYAGKKAWQQHQAKKDKLPTH